MVPPFLSFTAYNRLGLTARNIKSILDTPEDFEMHIIDSNSKDDTWEYLQSLDDTRIKSKTRLPANAGPIYAANLNLSKRRGDQYFIIVDSDVYIKTPNWISEFMRVFDTFPEVGLLGVMRGKPYPQLYPPLIPKTKNGVSYFELKYGIVDELQDFIHGCCQCIRPELLNEIGYWSEENGWGDAELSPRIQNYTQYKAGYMVDFQFDRIIDIDMTQEIGCDMCLAKGYCRLDRDAETCFSIRNKFCCNERFVEITRWKYLETFKELDEGKRTAYCASIHDPDSIKNHVYHNEWADENFDFYIKYTN